MELFDQASAKHKRALKAEIGLFTEIPREGSLVGSDVLRKKHKLAEARQKALEDCHAAAVRKADEDSRADSALARAYWIDRSPNRVRAFLWTA